MSIARIAAYSGDGRVLIEGREVPVQYRLIVSEYSDDTSVPGRKRIEGAVYGTEVPVGPELTLVTKEGYLLRFYSTNVDGLIEAASDLVTTEGTPVPRVVR